MKISNRLTQPLAIITSKTFSPAFQPMTSVQVTTPAYLSTSVSWSYIKKIVRLICGMSRFKTIMSPCKGYLDIRNIHIHIHTHFYLYRLSHSHSHGHSFFLFSSFFMHSFIRSQLLKQLLEKKNI